MLSPEPKNVINEGLTKKKSQEAQGQHSRGGGGRGVRCCVLSSNTCDLETNICTYFSRGRILAPVIVKPEC